MKHLLIAATTITLAVAVMPLGAQTGQQSFQQALVAERAKGDLDEAITLYQRAAKEAGTDRALAARALLAAARCYEKLGRDGARKLYEDVARTYGDQREQASVARERLGALAAPARRPDPEGLTTRQLAAPPSASWDMQVTGTEIVYVHSITGNLMAWDTTRRVGRILLAPEGDRVFQSFSVAPNGRDIVVQRQARRAAGADISDAPAQFCVTSLQGGNCRVIFEQPAIRRGQPVRGWSPDGRRFLAMIRDQDMRVLASIGASDGSIRKLATIGDAVAPINVVNFLKSAKYSPDGKYVAWTHEGPNEAISAFGRVHVVAADGNGQGMLVDEVGSNAFLDWTPDGRHILFLSNRDGDQALFVQAVSGGKAAGPARLVSKIASQVGDASMLPDGTLVYSTRDRRSEIYATDIDPSTTAFVGDLRPLSRRPVADRRCATWSPDGKQYAYLGVVNPLADPQPVLVVGRVDSGEERTIPMRRGPRPTVSMTWVGDSLYLNRSLTIDRVVVETGAETRLASFSPEQLEIGDITPAPGGSDLLVMFVEPGTAGSRRSGLLRMNATTGEWTEIGKRIGRHMTLSPDGTRLATREDARNSTTVLVKSVNGGEWKEVAHLTERGLYGGRAGDYQWTPDGTALLLVREESGAESNQAVLLRVPVDGSPVKTLAAPEGLNRMAQIRIQPNGKQAMFRALVDRDELWSVKNYLPSPPATPRR